MKMKNKKICLALSTVAMTAGFAFGGVFAFSQAMPIQAVAMETEFSNNGQFTVGQYSGPIEYVTGIAGADGEVLKMSTSGGWAAAKFDFSASQIKASEVDSIVVRIYSPEYTSADEFRTVAMDNTTLRLYGVNAYDMSSWCNITLNANSIADMTDANGYLSALYIGARVKSGATVYYIDSVTVNMKKDLSAEFTNNGQFAVTNYNANVPFEYVDGAGLPEGCNGSVLKIFSGGGAGYVNFDFSASKIKASEVQSVVARVYSPDYTADDELRINNTAGSVGGAGAHNLSAWCDVELPLSSITGADGNLGAFDFGLRDKGTISTYFYIDSITVNMAEEQEPVGVTFTGIHSWWNNYFHSEMYCSILEFSGGIAKGNLLSDYSDVYAKATLNGQPIDTSNFSLICRAWIDGQSDSIVMRWTTLPAAGSILHIPAGATFVNGSEDSNVYEIAEDVYMQFDGSKWAKCDKPAEAEKATFNSIWGSADIYNASDRVLLQFNSMATWTHTDKGNLASKVTYKNSTTGATYTATDSNIAGWEGQRWIVFTGMTDYDVIEIAEGGLFGGVEIPAVTIYKVNGRWVTTQASAVTTNFKNIASGWNNAIGGGLSQTIVSFDVNPLGAAADATNLAASTNRTSLMIKYNGKTFRDLYSDGNNPNAKQYQINYAHGKNYLYFAIPEADMVEGATFEIEAGTPFAGQGLGELKLVFKNGAWEVYKETNYNPDFVSIGLANQLENGEYFGLSLKYDTNGFTDANEQIMAASYTGITINGEGQAAALWGGDQLLFWIHGSKLAEGYNGYSHATFKITEGATVTNKYGETFTLGEATLYLVNGEWTTQKPADYSVTVNIPDLGEPDCVFKGFSHWNNENGMTLLEFTNFFNQPTTSQSYLSSTGHYITLNGTKLTEIPGTNIYTWENTNWLRIDIMNPAEGSVLIIEEGTPFAGNYLPKLIFQFHDGVWVQAFTVNMEINGETYSVYSKNDDPLILSDAYFENLLAEYDIPGKVVSFSTRGVTYPAGTVFKALTDTDITVEVIGFATTEGASVRLNTPTGIRYETKVNKADYDRLVAFYGEANVEMGTYIVPKFMLGSEDFRDYFADSANVDGTDYVRIVNSGFANKDTVDADGYYLYYGSLVNIQSHNYATDFFGIGYIEITDGDKVYTVFGGYDTEDYTRTIYYVASKAYNDYANGSEEQAVLKGYMDSVLYIEDDMVISNIVGAEGYVSPYSVRYDAQTGVYTVTGNAEMKSVIIGGEKRVSTRTSTLMMNGQEYYVTDYNLTASETYSTLTFKLSSVMNASALVDFTVEAPSYRGLKILQITDTELMDAAQMRTADSLTAAQKEEYARKNIYANCFNYISTLVAKDRPDLIILTGDIINGTFDDNGSMLLRLIEFMDSLDIPWAPVFGGLENASAQGSAWQREQLALSENCLFKAGNSDYTIGITDKGVLRRVIYMLDSNAGAGVSQSQVNWVKSVSANIAQYYVDIPAFVCFNSSVNDYASDFAIANVDGVFMGNAPSNNSTTLNNGIHYTYGTKTGSYGDYNTSKLGGTYIQLTCDGLDFTVWAECLNKTEMQEMKSIDLVTTYDGSSVVTDAYLTPIWDTDRIYDETGIFVGETGSVTLMYTPADPAEVVVRDITLGVTYAYGIDYTISGNKVTRVAGGNLPYMPYDKYYLDEPVYVNGKPQNWTVTTENGKTEDGYKISGTKYMYYDEGYIGASHHVMFSYDKTEAWTGTTITGDTKAQSFINKLKTEKEGTIMFYGDSITVGCNASGTAYGDYRNPYLPAWNDLVTNSLAETYGAKITKYNGAVGGWTTAQGAENFTAKVAEVGTTLADIDLLVIAFGMNDPVTSQSDYTASIKQMINAYYAANPNGSVLLVSPMLPNTQSSMICGNQVSCENWLTSIKNSSEYAGKNISLAKVFTMFNELVTVSGKLSRDYLGNNVNHPNDFGVRLYAQVILKTLCGDDFA